MLRRVTPGTRAAAPRIDLGDRGRRLDREQVARRRERHDLAAAAVAGAGGTIASSAPSSQVIGQATRRSARRGRSSRTISKSARATSAGVGVAGGEEAAADGRLRARRERVLGQPGDDGARIVAQQRDSSGSTGSCGAAAHSTSARTLSGQASAASMRDQRAQRVADEHRRAEAERARQLADGVAVALERQAGRSPRLARPVPGQIDRDAWRAARDARQRPSSRSPTTRPRRG